MEEKLSCEIVQDLLPNYVERLTSQTTNQYVENHLDSCESCKTVFLQMKDSTPMQYVPEAKDLKRYLNKTKTMYGMLGLLILGAVSMLTSIIVNLAVNRFLSWSLIVGSSIIFTWGLGYILITGKKNKLVKSLLYISIFLIPLLGVIQWVSYTYSYGKPSIWIWNNGIPITVMWLGIVWIAVFVRKVLKWNVIYSVAVILTLSLPGNYYTNLIVGSYQNFADYMQHFIGNGLGNLIVAILFWIIGLIAHIKKGLKTVDRLS